ncbi:UDP-N-acetylmuramoylalanine--D-glutamate ligase [Catenulispora sp. MAP12-49]|uniref:UDP-N-acetylmuramoyl-L-alanine--D-glutamate ligase n=1 Tax=Catenulispora sp. MAP12-49 TaxID=3156302 RepID=UPI0035113B1C
MNPFAASGPVQFDGAAVTVVGARVVGLSASAALLARGARVTLIDRYDDEVTTSRAAQAAAQGATLRLGDDETLPEGTELLVVSPGMPPSAPIVTAARQAGVPIWGDAELAWRLRAPLADGSYAPWLVVTGTNGKSTTVRMAESMLKQAGKNVVACGNIGYPVLDAVLRGQAAGEAGEPFEVLVIELSSYQLYWSSTLSPLASVVLNIAPDHIDWHGSYADYVAAKGRAYENTQVAAVYNAADLETVRLVEDAEVVEGCRAIGFTLGAPGLSMLGVVDGILADRAFIPDRRTSAAELGTVYDVEPQAPHNIANALAAAALVRAYGVEPTAVRDGLREFRPEPHRIAWVATTDGVDFVDDSKATNPHAASASIGAYDHVVWLAGGLAKGAEFDDLVERHAKRLRGAVLFGAERHLVAEALRRRAPEVPVVDLGGPGPERAAEVMAEAVAAARAMAVSGDTVLLAPACASMDMFTSYGQRGDVFAEAVRELKAREAGESGDGGDAGDAGQSGDAAESGE